jgi:hypothetical protein
MSSNAPRPEEDEHGRVVPFRRGKPRSVSRNADDTPVKGVEDYARSEPDNYRQRMINNGLALLFCVVLVSIGVWLANTIAEMRRNQDCVLSGRRNCAQVTVPPADPSN